MRYKALQKTYASTTCGAGNVCLVQFCACILAKIWFLGIRKSICQWVFVHAWITVGLLFHVCLLFEFLSLRPQWLLTMIPSDLPGVNSPKLRSTHLLLTPSKQFQEIHRQGALGDQFVLVLGVYTGSPGQGRLTAVHGFPNQSPANTVYFLNIHRIRFFKHLWKSNWKNLPPNFP